MRLVVPLLVIVLAIPLAVSAEDVLTPFPQLQTIEVTGDIFVATVHYDPAITRVVNESIEQDGTSEVRVLITKIDRRRNEQYEIRYWEGFSADPGFVFYKKGREIAAVSGKELYLPGNGSIYVAGHTNNLFNQHRKFDLKGESLVEVTQPFYYVGLESNANRDIRIYSDKKLSRPVANIPKGARLSVLLNEGDFFLIKTQFGLVGWIQYKSSSPNDYGIEGLYFNGD